MRPTLIIASLGVLALTACGDGGGSQQANRTEIKVRGPEQERLHQLNAFDLGIALKRAIYDAGYTCKRVNDGGFVGEYKHLDMWMATCGEGTAKRDWAIFTGPDGSAQVRDCRDVPGSGLPECKIKKRPTGSFTELQGSETQNAQ
jgi:hypothetical protein